MMGLATIFLGMLEAVVEAVVKTFPDVEAVEAVGSGNAAVDCFFIP